MSNFGGMGTCYDDDFEEFDLSHPKLIWVIPQQRRAYYKPFGLDTAKMVETLDAAMEQK